MSYSESVQYNYPVEIRIRGEQYIVVYLKDQFRTCSRCGACNRDIYRAVTNKGKKMPISQDIKGGRTSHFADCEKRQEYNERKKNWIF